MSEVQRPVGLKDRSFQGLLWTQALGAFNDNAFKTTIALLAVASLPAAQASRLIALAGALFVLPFILFSGAAGTLADRCRKNKLIVLFKAVELALMGLTFIALYTWNIPFLLVLLTLMGAQSAFFGPVKLAILPELLDDCDLSHGNGLMQMMTFGGILLGTVAAGFLVHALRTRIHWASLLFIVVAAAGLGTSRWVSDVPAADDAAPFQLNFIRQAWRNLQDIHQRYGVYLALMGTAYFWFLGAIFQMNILVYGKELMGVGEATLGGFQVLVAVGIGAGSWLAGRMSRGRVELGLVPAAALGLCLFSLDLAFAFRSQIRALADLFMLGVSAGAFAVPLQAFIQQRSPKGERGKYIATGNVVSFTAVLAASGCLWALTDIFRLHAGQVFLVVAAMTLAVAAYIVWMLPDFFLRLILYPIAHLLYALDVRGGNHVPMRGPALIVANHVSHVDPLFISAATPRLIRFLMYRVYYDLPVVGQIFRMMRCIPIAGSDSPKEMMRSFGAARQALEKGELVAIFAEGSITRHGQMLGFKKGFERIVKGLDVPVIPVHLDRVWGSIFSYERGRFLFKRPRRIPYPVTVSFGEPMRGMVSAHAVRQKILELGAAAFGSRLAEQAPLPAAFVRGAKKYPRRFAMADSSGQTLTFGQAMVRARVLGRAIVDALPNGNAVGLLLPPSIGGALANLGVAMAGKITVNLNYTASPAVVRQCAAKAKVSGIVTSRRFLEKLGWDKTEDMYFIEDIAAGISKLAAALTAAGMRLLPAFAVERLYLASPRRPLESPATVIFTSGSTGEPKGVLLSHANIHANIEGMAQLYQVTAEDRVMGALPFFHSFGHTVTLWFPLIAGFGAVYHFNPLDSQRIGDMIQRYRATFMMGTPTFLLAYLRRIDAAKLASVRYVIAGAEKLREEVARAFAEKYKLLPLEGYGCTELSPVTSVNIPDFQAKGHRQRGQKLGTIGQPLPGVLIKIVDPESGEERPVGEAGLMLVKGPNVMLGYIDDPEATAEALRDGYYVTGDIAAIDEDGFVRITDRLSRFSKIGGEMVPHIRIEEALHDLAGIVDRTFVVTAVPDEKRGERLVVLCKDFQKTDDLWRKLRDSDLPRLWLPAQDAFHAVDEIPVLGSGKLDLRKLKALAQEFAS
ncbi:MAG: acyl-[ACP]--phospholipid O-acyltransferase [Elusimicrobiota bacterium]